MNKNGYGLRNGRVTVQDAEILFSNARSLDQGDSVKTVIFESFSVVGRCWFIVTLCQFVGPCAPFFDDTVLTG